MNERIDRAMLSEAGSTFVAEEIATIDTKSPDPLPRCRPDDNFNFRLTRGSGKRMAN
jgi:hypothetical protein